MKNSDQIKAYSFVQTLCPTVIFKSGNRAQKADWRITSPNSLRGHHIVIERNNGSPVMKVDVYVEEQGILRKSEFESFSLCPDRSLDYCRYQKLLSLIKISKNKVAIVNLVLIKSEGHGLRKAINFFRIEMEKQILLGEK